ncbi:hypothetical protein CHH91_14985 [Virgibacillus sp. 7505]|uniref:hypothetical protein n=1 Tax=Virgibacillus sp. 7505 TaxID=2022548 RepID=UPI000BA5AECC|nr:hypothetical protein [Virgibacillus sp. 7505]PAE15379.1 hypothetical protein CHH91_14985 [Virgibacillus sp. 7505]
MEGIVPIEPAARQPVFVGRQKELTVFHDWLKNNDATSALFAISGMGGIGKSSLLARMNYLVKKENVRIVFLDGNACPQTPASFMEYVHSLLQSFHQKAPLDVLFHNPTGIRLLLCIDHFEGLAEVRDWFLHTFIPQLAMNGIGIVIATRKPLPISIAHIQTLSLPLDYLSYEESVQYIEKTTSLFPKQIHDLANKTDGLPLSLALAVDMVTTSTNPDVRAVSQTISAKILKEVTAVSLHPLLEVLIVMEYANQEIFEAVLGRKVSLEDYRNLQLLSFIDLHPFGLKLHDVAKSYLLQDFQLREPTRLYRLHRSCMRALYRELTHASQTDRVIIASALLKMNQAMWPKHNAYASFTQRIHQVRTGKLIASDLPLLHELLEEWCFYSVDKEHNQNYHDFLDAVVQMDPDSITILRDYTNKPIGMSITVLYTTRTAPLLLQHFQNELNAIFTAKGCRHAALQADTYIPILVTAQNDITAYTREELVGMLIVEQLVKLETGRRAILVATNNSLKQFLRTIGFNSRPVTDTSCDTSWARADIMELDLRTRPFGDWVLHMMPEEQHKQNSLSVNHMRRILQSIQSPRELNRYCSMFTDCHDGRAVQQKVLQCLQNPDGLSKEQQDVLLNSFVRYPNNIVKAVAASNMSRATFYRQQKKAIQKLTDILAL